jgi:HSP20 family protein
MAQSAGIFPPEKELTTSRNFFLSNLTNPIQELIKNPEKRMNINFQMEVQSMSFMPFDTLGEMARMRREIDRILGDDRPSSWTFPFSRISFLPGRAARAYPLINISEDHDNIYVDALAPGLEPEALSVSVSGDQLIISGEKKSLPKDIKSEYVHRNERSTGQFARSLSLSVGVESDKVQANYANGVLKITLPKMETAKPKQIQVKVG